MSRLLLLHIVVGEEELIVRLPRLLNNLIIVELLEQLVKLRVASSDPNVILIAGSSSFLELADSEIGAICALGTRFVIRSLEPSILTVAGEESLIAGPGDSHIVEGHNWQRVLSIYLLRFLCRRKTNNAFVITHLKVGAELL